MNFNYEVFRYFIFEEDELNWSHMAANWLIWRCKVFIWAPEGTLFKSLVGKRWCFLEHALLSFLFRWVHTMDQEYRSRILWECLVKFWEFWFFKEKWRESWVELSKNLRKNLSKIWEDFWRILRNLLKNLVKILKKKKKHKKPIFTNYFMISTKSFIEIWETPLS